MTLHPQKCVVVPNHPPIDKLLAFKRVQLDLGGSYRLRLAFCTVNAPTAEMNERWNAMCDPDAGGPYHIDVAEKKYHNWAPSASQVEANASAVTESRTFNMLVALINENNETGKLKSYPFSIAKMIRDVYEIAASQEVVFEHGMDVVNAFFFRPNGRAWEDLFQRDEYADLKKLWLGFGVSPREAMLPFTLPLYFRHLFLAGRSVAEIIAKVGWWLDKGKKVVALKDAAKKKVYKVTRFQIGSKQAGYVKVDGAFEFAAFSYAWVGSGQLAVAVIRNERGHVHIQSSVRHPGANFDELAKTLEAAEPGRWYYETRFPAPMLMNGSRQFTGVTPTDFSDDALIALVLNSVTFANGQGFAR